MLKDLAAELDEWFVEQAQEAVSEGMASPRASTIRVHGQMALLERDLIRDPVGHEAWMPEETEYETFFSGKFVTLKVADEECVLVSKAAKASQKNSALLTEYLVSGPSERFVALAAKYNVDLE